MYLNRLISAGIDRRTPQLWPLYSGGFLDRTKYVTASEIGRCARRVKYQKDFMLANGYVPELGTKTTSADDWGFWERGHGVEGWAVGLIQMSGMNDIMYMGDDQLSFVADRQSGTPDGVRVYRLKEEPNVDCCDIIEFKSFDPRSNVNKFPKREHVLQVIQNLDVVSYDMDLSPGRGHLLYIDASDWKRQLEFQIDFDLDLADELAVRAELIMEAETPESLTAEGVFTGECRYCTFQVQCNAAIRKEKNGDTNGEEFTKAAKFFG